MGFASPDSDYDVRFIYVHTKDWYLQLGRTRDVIEWQLDDVLDIDGWDLQKTLRLLHSSNPTIFEWNSSPTVYKTTEEWTEISKIINRYFLMKTRLHHYISTAKTNYREYLKGETVRLKKYFYVLRPLLACRWILDEQTPPPMLFSELQDRYLEGVVKNDVAKLVKLKMDTPEIGEGPRIHSINDYIDQSFIELETAINSLKKEDQPDWSELNDLFLRIIH